MCFFQTALMQLGQCNAMGQCSFLHLLWKVPTIAQGSGRANCIGWIYVPQSTSAFQRRIYLINSRVLLSVAIFSVTGSSRSDGSDLLTHSVSVSTDLTDVSEDWWWKPFQKQTQSEYKQLPINLRLFQNTVKFLDNFFLSKKAKISRRSSLHCPIQSLPQHSFHYSCCQCQCLIRTV